MPRKPKLEKKTIAVVVNGKPVALTLYPPKKSRRTWYVFWVGLAFAKTTGHVNFEDAVIAGQEMVKGGGKKPTVAGAVLSDEEFEAVQRAHYARKTDPAAKARAAKTLEDCLDCINAFKAITGLDQLAKATPDVCARFQVEALRRPKNWRKQYPKSKKTKECISPNTVLKWSRSLQAAFERVNRLAGKKCVRGVVDEVKLLPSNPWTQFTWIEGTKFPIRQLDGHDLLSFLDHLETEWPTVTVAAPAAKVFLWSACRKLEVASLSWDALRMVGDEVHWQIVGKWGVKRWFRVPESVYRELLALRTKSPFVFAAYSEQIRDVHADNPGCMRKIRQEYIPANFGDWFYRRVKDWSTTHPKGRAFVHHFRKTALQHARRGEDINREVAADARVGETVMMTSYVEETDEELRARSNRTYRRILASLHAEVAQRYGHVQDDRAELEKRLLAAIEAKDWPLATALSARLAHGRHPEAG